jgi:NAD(P)-dependent dehydrogenase (short-subunit alcohol dehydrogenase family)
VLPVLRAQRSGYIVTMSSSAGVVGGAFATAYAASKFALEGWMEGLADEIERFGIGTTIVEPGMFRTDLLVDGDSALWAELSVDDYAD